MSNEEREERELDLSSPEVVTKYKLGAKTVNSDDKELTRKVILIGSNFVQKLDSATKEALMDAAEKCVSVEFILLEQKLSHLRDLPGTINNFDQQISELENCSFRAFSLGLRHGSLKQIHYNLSSFYNPMIDGFTPYQGTRVDNAPLIVNDFRSNNDEDEDGDC
ncbi:hypothetical protein AgCh_022171 [Apium graveolens]